MRLKQGDFFGESCLSETKEDRQRLANVVAVGDVRVGCLKAADFKRVRRAKRLILRSKRTLHKRYVSKLMIDPHGRRLWVL